MTSYTGSQWPHVKPKTQTQQRDNCGLLHNAYHECGLLTGSPWPHYKPKTQTQQPTTADCYITHTTITDRRPKTHNAWTECLLGHLNLLSNLNQKADQQQQQRIDGGSSRPYSQKDTLKRTTYVRIAYRVTVTPLQSAAKKQIRNSGSPSHCTKRPWQQRTFTSHPSSLKAVTARDPRGHPLSIKQNLKKKKEIF